VCRGKKSCQKATDVLSAFCCYNKIYDKNNLEEEGFILAHSCRRFNPKSAGSVALGLR
jgi:hypothetical protein